MPLFARDEDQIRSAADADPKKTFQCLGCTDPLKLKKGPFRLPYFYHIRRNSSCREYGKSKRHLHIQLAIQRILPKGEATLEKPFPMIQRIADLVWEKEKIVFEVQCSRISKKEAAARIMEYRAMGYQVVWILDDRFFNRKTVSASEIYLREGLAYFVHFYRNFYIYDQTELFSSTKRLRKGDEQKIDITKPFIRIPELPHLSRGKPLLQTIGRLYRTFFTQIMKKF